MLFAFSYCLSIKKNAIIIGAARKEAAGQPFFRVFSQPLHPYPLKKASIPYTFEESGEELRKFFPSEDHIADTNTESYYTQKGRMVCRYLLEYTT